MTVIIISGTPGVGKHSIAESLSTLMEDVAIIDLNKIIISKNLLIPSIKKDNVVDIDRAFNYFKAQISSANNSNVLIIGHMAPYVIDPLLVDVVVILRRSPYELKQVYEQRSYSKNKIKDNLISEILGIISFDFLKNYDSKKIMEFEIKKNTLPAHNASEIHKIIMDKDLQRFGFIDWLPIVKNDPKMAQMLYEV